MTIPYTNDRATTPALDVPAAKVSVGPVEINAGPQGKYGPTDGPLSVWTDYHIRSRYECDKHRYMMGVTSPNGTMDANGQTGKVAFVQLASDTLLWIVDWTACQFNEPPKIPSQTPQDSNWILLDVHYEPADITVSENGYTPLYRISGTYVYGHRNPSPDVIANVNFGRPPWLLDEFVRTIPPNKLTPNLMDSNQNLNVQVGNAQLGGGLNARIVP